MRIGGITDAAISLRGSRDHVLDKVTMARGIDDSDVVFGSLKLPEGNVDGDTTLAFSFQFVKNPGIFERALSEFSRFLLKLHIQNRISQKFS